MVDKKEILFLVMIVLGVFISLSFTSAAVEIVSPANYTNVSGRIMVNVSFVNVTDIVEPLSANTTVYYNSVSVPFNNFTCQYLNSCNLTINTSDITDSVGRNLSVILGNATDLRPTALNVSFVLIDNTKPIVFAGNISSPLTVGNHSRNATLNVTVVDVTAGIRAVVFNITNITGVQNATYTATREGTTNQYSISINTSHFPDGTYNVTVFANDTTDGGRGNLNNSAFTYDIRFDNTPPVVFAGNISSPASASNHSHVEGLMYMNVTVTDATAAVRAVVFNITNITGVQNATYTATREGTTDQYSASLNSTNFPDGTYNVTVFANDTTDGGRGNLNNSARSFSVIFDNLPPVISYSCTPDPVTEQQTITCTCSVTDATSGVNSSATSFTANPSTSLTGKFSQTCSVGDLAGNRGSSILTYLVVGRGGSGSSGGGGGGGGGAEAGAAASESERRRFARVVPASPAIVNNLREEFGIKQIEVYVKNEVSDVKVTVFRYEQRPAAVSIEKTGKVYKYLEINTENLENNLNRAVIKTKVSKSWAAQNGLNKENVAMFKFVNGVWKELETKYKEEDGLNYYYDVPVNSFSFFAIGQKTVAEPPPASQPVEERRGEQTAPVPYLAPKTKDSSGIILIVIVFIAIALLILTVYFWRRKLKNFYG